MSDYQLDIVGIGTPIMDFLYTPEGLLITKAPGGSATNVVVRLQRLGLKTGLIGRLGNDEDGRMILDELKKERVDISQIRIHGQTARNNIEVTPHYRKIFKSESYAPIENLSLEDEIYIKSANSVLIRVGHPLFKRIVRENLAKRLFATLQLTHLTDEILELIKEADIDTIFGNEEEVKEMEKIMDDVLRHGVKVVRTLGKDGCELLYQNVSKKYNAYDVKTIDPTGAGDAFAAGFIYGCLNKWNLDECCKFANAMGALATTHYGARARLYTLEEVREFVKKTLHMSS